MEKVIDINKYKKRKKRKKKKCNVVITKTPYTDEYMTALNSIKKELDIRFEK